MGKLKIGFILFCCSGCFSAATAQKALTLDSCRALALRNNKQLQVARVNKEMTGYAKKSARTQYLPKVDAVAGYSYFSHEINLLSKSQKNELNNIGTTGVADFYTASVLAVLLFRVDFSAHIPFRL